MAPGTFLPENNVILIPDATLGSYFVTAGNFQNALPYTSQRGHVITMATSSRSEPVDSKSTTHNDTELDARYTHAGLLEVCQVRGNVSCRPNTMHRRYDGAQRSTARSLESQNLKFKNPRESDNTKTMMDHRGVEDDVSKQFLCHQGLLQSNVDRLEQQSYSQMQDFFYDYEEEDCTRECSTSLPKHTPSKWLPTAESRRNRLLSWQTEEQTTSQSQPRKHFTRSKNATSTKQSVKENENPGAFCANFEPDHYGLKKDDTLETCDRSYQKPARARNYSEHNPRYTHSREYNDPVSTQTPYNHRNKSSINNYRGTKKYNYAVSVLEEDFTGGTLECKDHGDSGESYVHRCPFHHCSHVRGATQAEFQENSQNCKLPLKSQPCERLTQLPATQTSSKSSLASRSLTTSLPISHRQTPSFSPPSSSEPASQSTSPVLLPEPPSSSFPPHLNLLDDLESCTMLQGNEFPLEPSREYSSTPCIHTMFPSYSPLQSNSTPSRATTTFFPSSVLNTTHRHNSGISTAIINMQLSEDFKNNIDNTNNLGKVNRKEKLVNKYSTRGDNFQDDPLQTGTEAEKHVRHITATSDSDHEMGDIFLEFKIIESPVQIRGSEYEMISETGAESLEPRRVEVSECSVSLRTNYDGLHRIETNISEDCSSITLPEYRANRTSIRERDIDGVISRNLLNSNVPLGSATTNTQVGLDSTHVGFNSTEQSSGYTTGGSPKESPRGTEVEKLLPGDSHRARKKMGWKTGRGTTRVTVTTGISKPALQEVTDSFRKKAIEYIVQQLSGHVGYTCCTGTECNSADCRSTECRSTVFRSNECRNAGCKSKECNSNGCSDDYCSCETSTSRGNASNSISTRGNSSGDSPPAKGTIAAAVGADNSTAKHTPQMTGIDASPTTRTSAANSSAANKSLVAEGNRAIRHARSASVLDPLVSDTTASTSLLAVTTSPKANNTSMAVSTSSTSANTSPVPSSASTAVNISSVTEATLSTVSTSLPATNIPAASNLQFQASNTPGAVNTQLRTATTPTTVNKAPLSSPSLQRLYKTVSKLEETVYAAAKGDKEIYMRHLAGKLATVYCQLQHTQQLPVPIGGTVTTERKPTTGDANLTAQTQLRGKKQ